MKQAVQKLVPLIIGISVAVVLFFSFREFLFGKSPQTSNTTFPAFVVDPPVEKTPSPTIKTTKVSCLQGDKLCIYENLLFFNGTFFLISKNPVDDAVRWNNELLNKTEEKQGHFRWRDWTGNGDRWSVLSVPHRILNVSEFASRGFLPSNGNNNNSSNITRIPLMIQHHSHASFNIYHAINDNALMILTALLRTMSARTDNPLCSTVECQLRSTRQARTLFLTESGQLSNAPLLRDLIQEMFPGGGEFLPGVISLTKLPNRIFWIDKLVWQNPFVQKMFYAEMDAPQIAMYRETRAFERLKRMIRRMYGVNTQEFLPAPTTSTTPSGVDPSPIVIHFADRSNNRKLLNFAALKQVVERERNVSIQAIGFGKMPLQQEVKFLRDKVHILIGVHGAALTNALLMEAPGVVVQICLKQQWQTDKDIYRRIPLNNGLKYVQWQNGDFAREFIGTHRIESESNSRSTFWRSVNIEIEPPEFLRIVDTALDLYFGRRNDTVVFLQSPPSTKSPSS